MLNPLETLKSQPRTFGMPGVFRYKFRDISGTYLRSEVVKLKQSVFSIYKSFSTDEHDKPKNVLLHWAIIAVVMCIATVIGFKSFAGIYTSRGTHKNVAVPLKPIQRPVSSVALNRVADSPPGLIPVPSVISDMLHPAVETWRRYSVDGYLDAGIHSAYMINGYIVERKHCRNYDKELRTVEYYGFEIPARRPGEALAQESSSKRSDSVAIPGTNNDNLSIGAFRNYSVVHPYQPKNPPF